MNKLQKYFSICRFLLVAFLFRIVCHNQLLASADPLVFNNLTTTNGLSHGDVTCFCMDYEGYMWIGTANGLNRYDGTNIKVYKKNQKDTSSLSANYINCIYEDNEKNLWIATSHGVHKYNRDQDNFIKLDLYYKEEVNYVANIFKDNNNNLWLETYNGCYIYNLVSKAFKPYLNEYFVYNTFQEFHLLIQGPKGHIWISVPNTENNGIYKIDPVSHKIERFHTNHPVIDLKENVVNSMFFDESGDLWVGYGSKGIDVFREGSGRIASYVYDPKNKNSLADNHILTMKKNDEGIVFIGTNGGGLCVFNSKTETFSHYQTSSSDRSILSNAIQNIYIDNDGMVWIACRSGGVSIFDKRFDRFSLFNNDKLGDNSGLLNNITCFTQDSNEKIWIASDGGGIFRFDPIKKSFKNYIHLPDDPYSLSTNKVLALESDNKDGLWAGTWSGGLQYFKIQGNNLVLKKKFNALLPDKPNSNSIYTLYIDKKGRLWVGTFGEGLCFYNHNTYQFEKVNFTNAEGNKIYWMSVRSIIEDHQGYLWIATELNGLYRYHPETGEAELFVHDEKDNTSIPGNALNFVFEDSKNRIWVGCDENGLGVLNEKDYKFKSFTTEYGLPDNTLVGMLEDTYGNLWLSSFNGLTRIIVDTSTDQIDFSCTNYSVYDGLQDRIFNRWAFFRDQSDNLYFGGPNGFNVFSPDNIIENTKLPQVYLTDFLLFNQPVSFNNPGSPLSKHISKTKKIVLEHYQSTITIRYVAINFIFSEKNQYAYYLEGFDDDSLKWNYVGTSREATYTNLDPGEYIFRVKASNNDGVWNEQGTSVIIKILPPWWKTIWFRILTVLIVTGLLLAFYYYRISRLKRQKVILEQLVNAKTADLSRANALLQERQQSIEEQSEELIAQKENLEKTNQNLKERQEFIVSQSKQLKNQNKELSVLNATKDKFFSIVAHDLRNPFSNVLGFSELLVLNSETMKRKKMSQLLQTLHHSAQRVFSLLENLLQWSRAQTGKIEVNKQEIDIHEMVNINIELTQSMASAKNITITSTIPDNTIFFGDYNLLNTIVRNLLTNAIKFTDKGTIKIYVNSSNSTNELCIQDTGTGISAEDLKNLFKIDKNSSKEGTQGETGTGLGLLICKEFVELINGKLIVESRVGKGSLFIISLPKPKTKV